MPRTAVIEIARFGRGLSARLSKSMSPPPGALGFQPIGLDPAELPKLDTSQNVDAYAERISRALHAHPAIRAELAQLASTAADVGASLRFQLGDFGEECRWEVLSALPQARFLALNGACTVTRIVQSGFSSEAGVQALGLPVRMAAFLSAANETAAQEFEAICEAVLAARRNGVDLACRIYLGEQALLDAPVEARGIEVFPMPSSPLDIEKALKDDPVQILHFFCHGLVETGERILELATIRDWDAGAPNGSVALSVDRLRQVLLATGSTWITVLNSCSGAASVDQLHSMALVLAQRASPFVVGMAEPIAAVDATLFAGAFYERLFEILKAGLDEVAAGRRTVLDLAPAVVPARDALHQRYRSMPPDAFGRWCLPIMYERDTPLEVEAIPAEPRQALAAQEMRIRIEFVSGALRILPATAPVEVRASLLALLDEPPAVPAPLRPDAYGRLA